MLAISLILLGACSSKKAPDPYEGKSAQEIFQQAETDLAKTNYAAAVKGYEALESRYPFGAEAEQAALDIIYAYYKSSNFVSALMAANRYIHLYPRSPHVDYAYYMKGIINMSDGRNIPQRYLQIELADRSLVTEKQAYSNFAELIRLYPNSLYDTDARWRMIYLRNLFAKHEIDVAEYYYERHTYLAAAQRGVEVVSHYQESPYVPQALAIMYHSYQHLNQEQLATNSLKILQKNFPNSKELKEILKPAKS